MFICIFELTLSLIIKLQVFWYFTIGFLYVFAYLVSVSISWSDILKLIFPERPSTNYFYIITFIDVLYSTYYLHVLLLQHGDLETNPGPPKEKLKNLLSNFETMLSDTTTNNALFVILGVFNARSLVWWLNDKNTAKGMKVTTVHGFHQLISQPTHLMPQSSSCIDLIFTDQPNLLVDSGVHPSLHSNCHHQITYCKLDINIKYPPTYEHLVWDYNKANVEGIKKSIESIN